MFGIVRAAAVAVAASLACASAALAAPAFNMVTLPAAAQQLAADVSPAETPVVSLPPAPVEIVTLTPQAPVPQARMLKPRSLVELIDMNGDKQANTAELECLAGTIYFESKGEPIEGQLAVAEVVLNRTKSGKFPTTICGVVKQRHQFSFVRGGRFPPIARNTPAWRKAVAIAHIALDDLADSRAQTAMFFHATYVRPAWRGLKRVAQVGRHIFYR
jgi:N-acetylmuramoyl-L-alanine amidase